MDSTIVRSYRVGSKSKELDMWEEICLDVFESLGKELRPRVVCSNDGGHLFWFSNNSSNVVDGECVHCNYKRSFVNKSLWGRRDSISLVYIEAVNEARLKNLASHEDMKAFDMRDFSLEGVI